MSVEKYRHPVLFYSLATAVPWGFWFLAAYVSHITPSNEVLAIATSTLGIVGLLCPTTIAFWMILRDPDLLRDIKSRFFNLGKAKPVHLVAACFLMLASILLAQAVSLLFGHSADQFSISRGISFSAGIVPGWFLLFLAPVVEELAWHSYGTDCLRQRFSLFATSMIFAAYWALWHFPLSFIKGYYHSNLAENGLLYSINFALSLIPYVILMNWLYYKTGRNILVAVVFHVTAGVFNEIFATHPDSKVIQTGILLVLSGYVLMKEKDFFFEQAHRELRGHQLICGVSALASPLKAIASTHLNGDRAEYCSHVTWVEHGREAAARIADRGIADRGIHGGAELGGKGTFGF